MKKYVLNTVMALGFSAMAFGALTRAEPANAGQDPVAAIILSAAVPGMGEWYNSGFSGGFPMVECIMGRICPCVSLASIIDAAAGNTDDGIRFDFWASLN